MSRWYTHGWNTTTSLRLILTCIPRVPRFLVPAVGVVTTAICISAMKGEREAAGRNLRRVMGRGGWRRTLAVWSLFYNYSRFMVSYCDLAGMTSDLLDARLTRDPEGERRFRAALDGGNGAVVLTAHLGNWEVGTRVLEATGRPVNVAMRLERRNAPERWLNRLRKRGGMRVLQVGTDAGSALALRAALARNEIVAMQGDRALDERAVEVEMFGSPFRFPLGPFLLAYGCRAALIPAFVLQEGWWRWRSEIGEPVVFPRTEDRDADIVAGVSQYARHLERIVQCHPEQWFNFYDLWPGSDAARPPQ